MNSDTTLTLNPPTEIKKDARFYGVNLLCELDSAGEYYINRENGTLYFWPLTPLETWRDDDTPMVVVAVNDTVPDVSNVLFVEIRGMAVSNSRGVGVHATGVTGVTLANLTGR